MKILPQFSAAEGEVKRGAELCVLPYEAVLSGY
jgi:hypothetical protein